MHACTAPSAISLHAEYEYQNRVSRAYKKSVVVHVALGIIRMAPVATTLSIPYARHRKLADFQIRGRGYAFDPMSTSFFVDKSAPKSGVGSFFLW